MARSALSILLILLFPLAGAISDVEGDTTERFGGPPVFEPSVDLRNVTATYSDGRLDLRMETWGTLMIGGQAPGQNESRLYTYLFIVGIGLDADANLYNHVAGGQESLTVICTFREGFLDLECHTTQGEAVLRGAGADDRNLTARFDIVIDESFAVGGSSQVSIPNGTARDILAQDFTDNALPYQGLPNGEQTPQGPDASADKPWWRSTWAILLLAGGALFVAGIVVPWEWFTPSHWRKK